MTVLHPGYGSYCQRNYIVAETLTKNITKTWKIFMSIIIIIIIIIIAFNSLSHTCIVTVMEMNQIYVQ